MEFFKAQRYRKRSSSRLYWLLALSIVVHTLVLSVVFGVIFGFFFETFGYWVFILAFVSTLIIYLINGFVEYQRNVGGGRAVAKRVGAVRLFIDNSFDTSQAHFTSDNQITGEVHTGVLQSSRHVDDSQLPNSLAHRKVIYTAHNIAVKDPKDFPDIYRRYYEFAAQMAIASGHGLPLLYVLPDEMGINGFVAGRHVNDMAMVLTQGAVEKLSDDGLYGLIAHLYGTILNGDAKFNIHLLVMMAGMQLIYNVASRLNDTQKPNGYQSLLSVINQNSMLDPANFKISDIVTKQAERLQSDTKGFEHKSQWVSYWRNEQKQSTRYQTGLLYRNQNEPSALVTIVRAITGSGVFWSKLITQRYNREREFLADASSVQLTRSHAIIETLRSIQEDSIGSRLVYTPHIVSIDHFLFASYGANVDDESWFSSHPSLNKRMQTVNEQAYQEYSRLMLNKKRINQAKLKEIYEARRRGTWQMLKEPIPSNAKTANTENVNTENVNTETATVMYQPIVDNIINGKLDTQKFRQDIHAQMGKNSPIKPYHALKHEGLPEGNIALADFKKINLPQVIIEHLFYPLGTLALIEVAMLCHQYNWLIPTQKFGLRQIWLGNSLNVDTDNHTQQSRQPAIKKVTLGNEIMPHTLNYDLLLTTAKLDRRMDSGLIELAVNHLRKQALSKTALLTLKQKIENTDSDIGAQVNITSNTSKYAATQQYKKKLNDRLTLLKYQQGLARLITEQQADESKDMARLAHPPQLTNVSLLWQTVHFYLVLSATSNALGEQLDELSDTYIINRHIQRQQLLFKPVIDATLDVTIDTTIHADHVKSAQMAIKEPAKPAASHTLSFKTLPNNDPRNTPLSALQLSKLQLLGLMLYQQYQTTRPATTSKWQQLPIHLLRLARLIDIPVHNDAAIQAIINTLVESLPNYRLADALGIIVHIKNCTLTDGANVDVVHQNTKSNRQFKSWLSTFYTAMLSDGCLAQEEYDILTLLTRFWLGKRVLIE